MSTGNAVEMEREREMERSAAQERFLDDVYNSVQVPQTDPDVYNSVQEAPIADPLVTHTIPSDTIPDVQGMQSVMQSGAGDVPMDVPDTDVPGETTFYDGVAAMMEVVDREEALVQSEMAAVQEMQTEVYREDMRLEVARGVMDKSHVPSMQLVGQAQTQEFTRNMTVAASLASCQYRVGAQGAICKAQRTLLEQHQVSQRARILDAHTRKYHRLESHAMASEDRRGIAMRNYDTAGAINRELQRNAMYGTRGVPLSEGEREEQEKRRGERKREVGYLRMLRQLRQRREGERERLKLLKGISFCDAEARMAELKREFDGARTGVSK
ncbi:hypothetical protein KIPB_002292 [Kipferlia bialata]|uniref:Uncharacterized protein n=1 Tax=Kipferlia bialata TaxID=797122 RepID=A0A9K3GG41_9EUKA|nr:hypothetical protein KIPB_002292 [Kipferlia bialata]|eukprot:g2292.t1